MIKERKKYRFISDPGHGWLEVPMNEVVESGAEISAFSYYNPKTNMAYLEEDCDCFAYLKAANLIEKVDGKWIRHYDEEEIYQENTFIRSLGGLPS